MRWSRIIRPSIGGITLSLLGTAAYAATAPAGLTAPGITSPGYPDFWDSGETVKVVRNGSGSSSNRYYTLTSTGSNAAFNFPSNAWNLSGESVKITANFDRFGNLITAKPGCFGSKCGLTNEVLIRGKIGANNPSVDPGIPSWSAVTTTSTLFRATINGYGVDLNDDPSAAGMDKGLGFKTTNFSGWAADSKFTGGSTTESTWLFNAPCTTSTASTASSGCFSGSGFGKLLLALDGNGFNGTLDSIVGSSKSWTGVQSITTVPLPAAVWLFGSALLGMSAVGRRNRRAAAKI